MTTIIVFLFMLLLVISVALAYLIFFVAMILAAVYLIYIAYFFITSPPEIRQIAPEHQKWLFGATCTVAYLLFPVFVTDFAVAGARLRHDVIAINAWSDTWLWAILLAANVPLLPLFQAASAREWTYLAVARRLWLAVWATFVAATAFTWLAHVSSVGATLGKAFDWAYFWWGWALAWLEADGIRTTQELAVPMFRYRRAWAFDVAWLMSATFPLLLFYRAKLAELKE